MAFRKATGTRIFRERCCAEGGFGERGLQKSSGSPHEYLGLVNICTSVKGNFLRPGKTALRSNNRLKTLGAQDRLEYFKFSTTEWKQLNIWVAGNTLKSLLTVVKLISPR